MLARFGEIALGAQQVVAQLARALLLVMDRLLGARKIGAERVIAALHFVEAIVELGLCRRDAFRSRHRRALLGDDRFEAHFQLGDVALALLDLTIEMTPLQRLQLRLEQTLFFFQFGVAFGRLRLALQMLQLTLQLVAQIGEALEIFLRATHAVFGFAAALFVFRDAGGLFNKHAQLIGLGFDQLRNHALFDDGVAARTETGAEEDIGDVATPAFLAVEVIVGHTVARDLALDRDFRKGGVFATEGAVGVIEDQLDGGEPDRFAIDRAIENDVGHRLAAQVFGRAFAHHPAHGVDDIRFAATVGADYRHRLLGKLTVVGSTKDLNPANLMHFNRIDVRDPVKFLIFLLF